MILYFAGSEPKKYRSILKDCKVENILLSYFYFKSKAKERLDTISKEFKNVFLDSGGFTARTKGKPIDIKEYKDFLLTIKDIGINYANLDLKTYEETKHNQDYLESFDLKPIPVYHFSEYNSKDRDVLLEYIKKYNYIAIGGVVGAKLNGAQKNNYLNYVFKHTKDKIKVHGFGITDMSLMKKYPFYSVDSTSWQQRMRFGQTQLNESTRIRITKNKSIHYLDLLEKEVLEVKQKEKLITSLWAKRGIIWK